MGDFPKMDYGRLQVLGPRQEDVTSLSYLQSIYRDRMQPASVRMRAAIAALPFEGPKFAVVANINHHEMANRLEARIARLHLIEGPKD